jgi:hypothetical protein
MELVREYLIVSFLYRQEREKRSLPAKGLFGYFGNPTGFREHSPEMVRKEVYKMFGKGGANVSR